MAGTGTKLWATGDTVTATQFQTYLQDQVVSVFDDSSARDAAFGGAGEPTLAEGMVCYLEDTNIFQIYSGSAWISLIDLDLFDTSKIELNKDSGSAYVQVTSAHDTEATTPYLIMRKSDGSTASPALVDDNAILGTISFQGYDGNSWANGAKILAMTDGSPADGDMPTEMIFQVTPDGGSETPATALTISPNGVCTFAASATFNTGFTSISTGGNFITNTAGDGGIAYIQFSGGGSGYTHSDIRLYANAAGRGAGMYCMNSSADVGWYTGNPYGASDQWAVCRSTASNGAADDSNALLTLSSSGALSKASGTFDIAHPTKGGDWRLRHSFVEGPQADNMYRGTITLSGGSATVDLDTTSNMTDGTWEALNTNPWSMVASSGNAVEWSLSGKTLTITGPDNAVCQWMVIGERQDDHMKENATNIADDDGKIIVEYERVTSGGPILGEDA